MSESDNLDFLTLSQRQVLESFLEVSQLTDSSECLSILESADWNLDHAVNIFISMTDGRPTGAATSSSAISSSRHEYSYGNNRHENEALNMNSSHGLLDDESMHHPRDESSPFLSGQSRNYTDDSSNEISNTPNQENTFLSYIFSPLKWLVQSTPVSTTNSPINDTHRFIQDFEQKYSSQHPEFSDCSYSNAAVTAFQNMKYLMVYLHSPMHEDTSRFCRETLSNQTFIQFSNENVVTWAGNVWDVEAYNLSIQLKATAFPFVALLICQSERVVQVIDRVQGFLEENELLQRLQNCISVHGETMNRIQSEALRTREFSILREQQDREYRELEEADRLVREQREKEELERQQKEHEEQQRLELEQAIQFSKKLSHESEINERRNRLQGEPESGEDIATIRFQLPRGAKTVRRFYKSDSIQVNQGYFLFLHVNDNLCFYRLFTIIY